MLIESLPLLFLGFGLGFMHALDADHVMAVSMLSNQKPGFKRSIFHSAHWALGHGAVLLLAGILLFGLGVMIPETMQKIAEASVGVLLIVLGLLCFWQFNKEKVTLKTHTHGDIQHTHWHDDSHQQQGAHKPIFIGALHGLAGSAPALALIPAVASGQLSLALTYLVLFSVGVMLSMLAFGLGFGVFQRWLSKHYQQVFQYSRHALASFSIVLGGFWLVQAI